MLDGIRNTARAMQAGKIKISPDCKAFIHELQGYVWQDRADTDAPVKEADHACDSCRYFVETKNIAPEETLITSAFM